MNNPEMSEVGRRRLIWRICEQVFSPTLRTRVIECSIGPEAIALAVFVELLARDKDRLHALLADPGNEIRTVYEDETGVIHEVS